MLRSLLCLHACVFRASTMHWAMHAAAPSYLDTTTVHTVSGSPTFCRTHAHIAIL